MCILQSVKIYLNSTLLPLYNKFNFLLLVTAMVSLPFIFMTTDVYMNWVVGRYNFTQDTS